MAGQGSGARGLLDDELFGDRQAKTEQQNAAPSAVPTPDQFANDQSATSPDHHLGHKDKDEADACCAAKNFADQGREHDKGKCSTQGAGF